MNLPDQNIIRNLKKKKKSKKKKNQNQKKKKNHALDCLDDLGRELQSFLLHAYLSRACATAIITEFCELFSLKRIYAQYKNDVLSHIRRRFLSHMKGLERNMGICVPRVLVTTAKQVAKV